MTDESDITGLQKELAEISIQNGLLQLSLWDEKHSVEPLEIPELSEEVLPKVSLLDFTQYLDKFKDRGHFDVVFKGDVDVQYTRDLPKEFYREEFRLDAPEVVDLCFREDVAQCEEMANELCMMESFVDEQLFQEMLDRDQELGELSRKYTELATVAKTVHEGIQSERASLQHGVFDSISSCAEESVVLKRKKKNLEIIVNILVDVKDAVALFRDLDLALGSIDAAEAHHEDIYDAFAELRDKVESLRATCAVLETIPLNDICERMNLVLLSALQGEMNGFYETVGCPETLQSVDLCSMDTVLRNLSDLIKDSEIMESVIHKTLKHSINAQCWNLLGHEASMYNETEKDGFYSSLVQIKEPEQFVESLLRFSREIIDHSIVFGEHYDRVMASPQCSCILSKCISILSNFWREFLLALKTWIQEGKTDPGILKISYTSIQEYETLLESTGQKETLETLLDVYCDAAMQVLNQRFDGCAKRLSDHIQKEVWSHVSDASNIRDRLSNLLEMEITLENNDSSDESYIVVSGRKYACVASIISLADSLMDLKLLVADVPALDCDIGRKSVEICRQFNSQTCQLILGAGAIQSAGLRSITVKHLSIACQQITLVKDVANFLQNFYLGMGVGENGKRLILRNEFERCINDMKLHCDEIRNKIVSVSCDLMIPLIKDASMLLTSMIMDGKYKGELVSPVTDLLDAVIRNFNIVARIAIKNLHAEDVNTMLESIWQENIVWLRDSALSFDQDNDIASSAFIQHIEYIEQRIDRFTATCLNELKTQLRSPQ